MKKVSLHLQLNPGYSTQWYSCSQDDLELNVKGFAYIDSHFYKGRELVDLFVHQINKHGKDGLEDMLQMLNGHFVVVAKSPAYTLAAVDRIRSFPLFYASRDGSFYISDDAYWVMKQVGDDSYDPICEQEYLVARYVTGKDTLSHYIKQIQAGELLIYCNTPEGNNLTTKRYYIYYSNDSNNFDEEEARVRLNDVLSCSIARLVDFAKGRPIFLPLSGGYDSRLLALMLKKFDYTNVIAFTYGKVGNNESRISKEVAKHLGIKWEFVPYDNASWFKWFHSQERQEYYYMADGLTSLPAIQNWPSIWELKKRNLIPDDAIFVPGHTGDFISGGHIPKGFWNSKSFSRDDVIRAILNKHYVLWEWNRQEYEWIFKDRISGNLIQAETTSTQDGARLYEQWEWQERQCKFIVNSVRAYEYWGYDWYLPLWDLEHMNFWMKIPLSYKIQKRLYESIVDKLSVDLLGKVVEYHKPFISKLKKILTNTPAYSISRRMVGKARTRVAYETNPLALYGIMPEEQFNSLYTGHETMHSFCTLERLGKISFKSK